MIRICVVAKCHVDQDEVILLVDADGRPYFWCPMCGVSWARLPDLASDDETLLSVPRDRYRLPTESEALRLLQELGVLEHKAPLSDSFVIREARLQGVLVSTED